MTIGDADGLLAASGFSALCRPAAHQDVRLVATSPHLLWLKPFGVELIGVHRRPSASIGGKKKLNKAEGRRKTRSLIPSVFICVYLRLHSSVS
jgi:hypothetical protein